MTDDFNLDWAIKNCCCMPDKLTFENLTNCPFCNCEEFYTRNYMYGSCSYFQRFDGAEAYDNSQMYDGLTTVEGVKCYCGDCGEYLGNLNTGKLSKKCIKKILEQEG